MNASQTSIPRLSSNTVSSAKPGTVLPGYDRAKTRIGVVHFGPGAFHRGHQACYFDSLLPHDPRWAICGAELLPTGLAAEAVAQDHLYVVAELDAQVRYRVVGSHREYLKASTDAERIFARLMLPETRLVTMTVTEKGYCLDGAGTLDFRHPAIAGDLGHPKAPNSLVGWVTEALARRRESGHPPFVVMSCDNMVSNGHKLRGAVLSFAEARGDRDLAAWIADAVRFPSTMVDSITPAADEALKARIAEAVGLRDEAPVQRERFQQWVVEDVLGRDAPDLARVGVSLTSDVAAYEFAKLRLLNGAHSTLAYAGLLFGHDSVGAAMDDPRLGRFVARMMRQDIAPSLHPTPGLDFESYIADILQRFRNPALTHKLYQIASDGTQKLPYRILATTIDALDAGRPVDRLAVPIGAWMRFVVREAKAGREFQDPMSARLVAIGKACNGTARDDLPRFFALKDVFPERLTADPRYVTALSAAYEKLETLLD